MIRDFQYEWLHLTLTEEEFITAMKFPEALVEQLYSDALTYGPNADQVTAFAEKLISNLAGATFDDLANNPTWQALEGLWEKSIEMHSVGAFFNTIAKDSSPAAFVVKNLWSARDGVDEILSQMMKHPVAFKARDSVVVLLWFIANDGNHLYPKTGRVEKLEESCQKAIAIINCQ